MDAYAARNRDTNVFEDGNEGFHVEDSGMTATRLTNAKTQQEYLTLYGGPEYLMHYKYASVIYMIYVTFMYGMFLPIFFPITLFGIFNTYMTEKISLIWFYKKPPMFDESLGNQAFKLL